jgi:hypothetical protein
MGWDSLPINQLPVGQSSGPTVVQRGYVKLPWENKQPAGNEKGYYEGGNPRLTTIDGAAQACDADPKCKSFTVTNPNDYTDAKNKGLYNIYLNSNKLSTTNSNGTDTNWYYHYNKPDSSALPNSDVKIAALASVTDGYTGGNGTKSDSDYTHTTPLNDGNNAHKNKNQIFVDKQGYFCRGCQVYAHSTILPSMCRVPGTVIQADFVDPGSEAHDNSKTPGAIGSKFGSNGSLGNFRVQCLYSNLDPQFTFTHWNELDQYLVTDTDIKLAKQQACLSGYLGNKLASNTYCNAVFSSTGRFTKTDLDIAVLKSIQTADDLKADGNLTYMANACKNTNISTNQTLKQACIDASKKISTSSWDSVIINGINSFNTQAAGIFPTEVNEGIDGQMKTKCDTTNGRTDKSCACFNAVKFGVDNCAAGITGCEDIIPYTQAVNLLNANPSGKALGAAIKLAFKPRAVAAACTTASSTTALYGSQPTASDFQLGACLPAVQSTNSSIHDIQQKCDINQSQDISTYVSNPILAPPAVNPSAAAGTIGFACTTDTQCTAPLKCASTGACGAPTINPVIVPPTPKSSSTSTDTKKTEDDKTSITNNQKLGIGAFCCCIVLLCILLIAGVVLMKK